MTRKQRRLVLIGAGLGVLAVAVALMLNAFRGSIAFFNSPSDIAEKHLGPGTRIRLGGLVEDGSIVRGADLRLSFKVTDGKSEIPVTYQGACCRTCSAKARASLPKAASITAAPSMPTPFWPSTTRSTCRKR